MGGMSKTDGRFECVEVPHHIVQITKGFYIGKYPVTQEQYEVVRKRQNPSKSTKHPQCPVDNIGVEDANAFCHDMSEITGADIRLPTEAEWEYAARGNINGTTASAQWFFGNDPTKLDNYAWHKGNSNGKSHPVGMKEPNLFGLYDIYGNVFERVSDTYHKEYYAIKHQQGNTIDPKGPSQGIKSKFHYELIDVPIDGIYSLTATVCTVTVQQTLTVSTAAVYNKDDASTAPIVMELPYTMGEWQNTNPVLLSLNTGMNTLYFWRENPPQYGVSIKEFKLTKV